MRECPGRRKRRLGWREKTGVWPDWQLSDGAARTLLKPDRVAQGEAKGWSGQFERVSFDSGFHVHMGALDVREDSEITASGSGGEVPISVFSVTKGRAQFKAISHPAILFLPRTALIQQNRDRTATFLMPGKQRMEFLQRGRAAFGLCLAARRQGDPGIAPLLDQGGDARFIWRTVSMRPALYRLVCDARKPATWPSR